MKSKLEKIPLPYRLLMLLGFILISVIVASHSIYIEQEKTIEKKQKEIDDYVQDIPKFAFRLGNVWYTKVVNNFPVFIEMGITNSGLPSAIDGWRAELKLGSQLISCVSATSIPEGFKLFEGDKLIAEFHKDNDLISKVTEEPLAKGARKAGWLRFDFKDITEEQLIKAEKTIYVRDVLNREHSFKFKEIPFDIKTYVPASGTPPFKL